VAVNRNAIMLNVYSALQIAKEMFTWSAAQRTKEVKSHGTDQIDQWK
jgi:hypothetical protein